MIELIRKLNIKLDFVDIQHIDINKNKKARGAFRWDYQNHRAEIVLAKSANQRTMAHEIGHAINFILGNGNKYSDRMGINSEDFANIVADIIELCYNKNQPREGVNH